MRLFKTQAHSDVYDLWVTTHPDINLSDIADTLSLSVRQVETIVAELSEDGLIETDSQTTKK